VKLETLLSSLDTGSWYGVIEGKTAGTIAYWSNIFANPTVVNEIINRGSCTIRSYGSNIIATGCFNCAPASGIDIGNALPWFSVNSLHYRLTLITAWNGDGIGNLTCNGGYTQTCAITPTSQAYNSGSLTASTFTPPYDITTLDARGAQRYTHSSLLVSDQPVC